MITLFQYPFVIYVYACHVRVSFPDKWLYMPYAGILFQHVPKIVLCRYHFQICVSTCPVQVPFLYVSILSLSWYDFVMYVCTALCRYPVVTSVYTCPVQVSVFNMYLYLPSEGTLFRYAPLFAVQLFFSNMCPYVFCAGIFFRYVCIHAMCRYSLVVCVYTSHVHVSFPNRCPKYLARIPFPGMFTNLLYAGIVL